MHSVPDTMFERRISEMLLTAERYLHDHGPPPMDRDKPSPQQRHERPSQILPIAGGVYMRTRPHHSHAASNGHGSDYRTSRLSCCCRLQLLETLAEKDRGSDKGQSVAEKIEDLNQRTILMTV